MNVENEKDLPKRKGTRLKGFDYSSAGAYFVTVCTRDRKRILSDIIKPPVPTVQNSVLSRFVSTPKRFCNKEYGTNIWQYRSNDHIIRNRQDHEGHLRYIDENPARWYYYELYAEE